MLAFFLFFDPYISSYSRDCRNLGACEVGASEITHDGWNNSSRPSRAAFITAARTRPQDDLKAWCFEDPDDLVLACTALAYETDDHTILGRACELGDVEACGPWGYRAFEAASPEDKPAIQARLLDACERGGGAACAAYAHNTRIEPAFGDVPTAVGWAHFACWANYDGWACAEASWLREANGFPEESVIPGCQNSDAVVCTASPTQPASLDAMEYVFGKEKRPPRAP